MLFTFFIGSFISLFALINPLSALPVFISLTTNHDSKWTKLQVRKTCVYTIAISIVAFLIGSEVLNFFGISINALKIAGGIIISRSGFLLLSTRDKSDKGIVKKESLEKKDIAFSPLAMPLLSGPGSISLLINMSIEHPLIMDKIAIVAAIVCVAACIYVIFSVAPRIFKFMGQTGLNSMSKIMGFIVLAIGIEMISNSIISLLKTIPINL